MYGTNRRDFLKGSVATATALAPQTDEQVNKGPVYDLAKKVWDLSKEAWYPERYIHSGFIADGVMGILNLESEGKGRYLQIVNNGGRDSSIHKPSLELTLVSGIDKETTKRIDSCLANLWLKYTPPIKGIDQEHIKKIGEIARRDAIPITSTMAALFTIWEKNILGYAKEHKLNVLKLESSSSEGLGNLYSAGIVIGNKPCYGGNLHPLTDFTLESQEQIIMKYKTILTKAILPLEKEIIRINNLRSNKTKIDLEEETEKRLMNEAEERRRLEQEARDLKISKEKERFIQIAQKILRYPI